jgi:hypothetical protein
MRTPMREQTRAERMREYAARVEQARGVVAAMGPLVRGREARARRGDTPLEVEFSEIEVDERALPAAVWVALRRDDVDAAIETMTTASRTDFVIEEREVMGEGYRLQAVQDACPLPEPELLIAQLSVMLGVPRDVLAVIAEWGPDDPRAGMEIDALLTARFGLPGSDEGSAAPAASRARPEQLALLDQPDGRLTMTVADATEVLRLDAEQVRALEVLVRKAAVTLTLH